MVSKRQLKYEIECLEGSQSRLNERVIRITSVILTLLGDKKLPVKQEKPVKVKDYLFNSKPIILRTDTTY